MPDLEVTAAVLGRLIVQAGRALDGPFSEALDRFGITRNSWWLLTELYRTRAEQFTTIGEHARRSGLAPSSATIATEQLTGRRLTRRWRPKDNRRITFVAITEAGVKMVQAIRLDLERSVAGLYEMYDAGDRQVLHDLLVRMIEADPLTLTNSSAESFTEPFDASVGR